MLYGNQKAVIVDVIDSDGKIIPTYISKVPGRQNGDLFEVDFLHDPDLSQQIHVDGQGRVARIVLKKQRLTLDKAEPEDIAQKFPEHADFVMQNKSLFDRD